MGLNINKKYDKTYKYYNAKHNITRMLRYINIYIIGEVGDIQHRIILRYENEFIPAIKNIIADFNLTNNIKS